MITQLSFSIECVPIFETMKLATLYQLNQITLQRRRSVIIVTSFRHVTFFVNICLHNNRANQTSL